MGKLCSSYDYTRLLISDIAWHHQIEAIASESNMNIIILFEKAFEFGPSNILNSLLHSLRLCWTTLCKLWFLDYKVSKTRKIQGERAHSYYIVQCSLPTLLIC